MYESSETFIYQKVKAIIKVVLIEQERIHDTNSNQLPRSVSAPELSCDVAVSVLLLTGRPFIFILVSL